MKVHELNHVAVHVADVERSSAFYREVVGLQQVGTVERSSMDLYQEFIGLDDRIGDFRPLGG